jgi:hypothetical protein
MGATSRPALVVNEDRDVADVFHDPGAHHVMAERVGSRSRARRRAHAP